MFPQSCSRGLGSFFPSGSPCSGWVCLYPLSTTALSAPLQLVHQCGGLGPLRIPRDQCGQRQQGCAVVGLLISGEGLREMPLPQACRSRPWAQQRWPRRGPNPHADGHTTGSGLPYLSRGRQAPLVPPRMPVPKASPSGCRFSTVFSPCLAPAWYCLFLPASPLCLAHAPVCIEFGGSEVEAVCVPLPETRGAVPCLLSAHSWGCAILSLAVTVATDMLLPQMYCLGGLSDYPPRCWARSHRGHKPVPAIYPHFHFISLGSKSSSTCVSLLDLHFICFPSHLVLWTQGAVSASMGEEGRSCVVPQTRGVPCLPTSPYLVCHPENSSSGELNFRPGRISYLFNYVAQLNLIVNKTDLLYTFQMPALWW